jgi:hypothetical protein
MNNIIPLQFTLLKHKLPFPSNANFTQIKLNANVQSSIKLNAKRAKLTSSMIILISI